VRVITGLMLVGESRNSVVKSSASTAAITLAASCMIAVRRRFAADSQQP
jgi:hypothetical protein